MDFPEFDADLFVYSLILGCVSKSIPDDARQKIQNGEVEKVLEQTVGNAFLRFTEVANRLEGVDS